MARGYLIALASLAVASGSARLPVFGRNPGAAAVCGVGAICVSALAGGLGPGLVATGLWASTAPSTAYRPSRVALSVVGGLVVSLLAGLLHRARRGAARQARHLAGVEERARRLFESNPQPMWVFDVETLGFLDVNEAAVRAYGYSREEFAGMTLDDLRAPEDVPRLRAAVAADRGTALAEGGVWRLRRKDGRSLDVEIRAHALVYRGRPARVVQAQDVTERLRLERAARDGDAALRSFFDHSPVMMGIVEVDGEETRFLSANAETARLYRREPEEMAGLRLRDVLPASLVEVWLARYAEIVATGRPLRAEYARPAEGGDRWIAATLCPIPTEPPAAPRVAFVATDRTEARRAEAERIALLERAEAATRAAEAAGRAKDHFLALLSHELRTPLTPVLALVSGQLDDPRTPEPLRQAFELIRRNVEREARLIDDLLDVTVLSGGEIALRRETLDLHALAHQAADAARPPMERAGVRLVLDLAATTHHLWADPGRLAQVVNNLLRNAATFTPRGGTVRLSTRDEGPRLVVQVADDGIGIEPGLLPRLFEAFAQAEDAFRRRHGGLGLGLAISRVVAERHGGTLTAQSPGPGLGATFRLTLDAAPPPPPPRGRPPAPRPTPR